MIRYEDNLPVKYYSSNDAMILIGDYFVDEAVAIAYSFKESKIPIYSYNSKFFKRVATGKTIVQGTLTINYIHDDYFNNLISVYKKDKEVVSLAPQIIGPNDDIIKNKNEIAKVLASNPAQRREIFDRIKSRRNQIKNLLENQTKENFSLDFENLNSPTTNMNMFTDYGPVNILVTHDNPLHEEGNVRRIIKNVYFTGLEHQAHPTGQTQVETYSFFAEQVI